MSPRSYDTPEDALVVGDFKAVEEAFDGLLDTKLQDELWYSVSTEKPGDEAISTGDLLEGVTMNHLKLDPPTLTKTQKREVLEGRMSEHNCGFWIEDGWIDLIYDLHLVLKKLVPHYTLDQVKQKFRSARVYISQETYQTISEDPELEAKVQRAIRFYEEMAGHICEACGGYIPTSGEVFGMNYCDNCQETFDKERGIRKDG